MSGLHVTLKTEMEKLAFGVLVRERKWANVVRFTAAASRLVGRWHGSALRRTRPSASLPRLSTLSTDIYQTAACCSLSQGTYFLHRYHRMTSLCLPQQSQKDPMLVEKIMNDLDSNQDNEVDFNEFVVLVAALTVACNDFFQEQKKKAK